MKLRLEVCIAFLQVKEKERKDSPGCEEVTKDLEEVPAHLQKWPDRQGCTAVPGNTVNSESGNVHSCQTAMGKESQSMCQAKRGGKATDSHTWLLSQSRPRCLKRRFSNPTRSRKP